MTHRRMPAREDARRRRTRSALQAAFIGLFFERDFDDIAIADVAARAGVGRSTLYEHYRGKDELLLDTVRYPFEGLAVVVDADVAVGDVAAALAHFWRNRANARSLRRDSSRRALARVYAGVLVDRLARQGEGRAGTPALAAVVAEAHLGVLMAWLAGDIDATPERLAGVLVRIAQATLGA
jgi:AcrR family transcriptional regulator